MTCSRSLGPAASTAPPRKPRGLRHVATPIICAGVLNGAPAGVRSPAARVVLSRWQSGVGGWPRGRR